MRTSMGIMLLLCGLAAASGCATSRAYPGPRRAPSEVASLVVAVTGLHVDGVPVIPEDAHRVEVLPGRHRLDWIYEYPNGYREPKSLDFEAMAGQRYRLGERFFPVPHPAGPAGVVFDLVVDTALTPIRIIGPSDPPAGPPEGEYYNWIVDRKTERVVASVAPDVPLDHSPITYVPTNLDEP